MRNTSLDRIVQSKRLPILFIGSGITKRYTKNSPTWEELIEECYSIVDPTGITLTRLKDKCKREGLSIFETNQFLGTEIENLYNDYYFDKLKVSGKDLPPWCSDVSPFKMHLRNRFSKTILRTESPKSYLSRELQLFSQLNQKISAVITTNYDKFIENYIFNDGFDVYHKQTDLFKSTRYNIAEIYKIHGCIDDANSLIFTKKDYDSFIKNRRLIIAKMLTLFSDSPIIFLGYSLEDENIRNLILDFLDCIDQEDIYKLKDHFIFVEYKKDEKNLVETTENIVTERGTIPITKISTDNFSRLFFILNKITPGLPSNVVKNAQKLIKTIVENSLETGTTNAIIIDEENISSLENENLAIAFGSKQSLLSKYGYSSIHLKYLFEDILFDNKNFDAASIIGKRLKSTSYKTLVPVHKYYSQLTDNDIKNFTHINKFLSRNSYDSIFTNNITKRMQSVPTFDSLEEIEDYIEKTNEEKVDKIFKLIGKNLRHLNNDEIRILAQQYYNVDSEACFESTFFKRTVMYLDVIENYK